ncbi:unnamed protein product [Moneuplotes crassus]|uniref:Uncharacterized protein n=1 Tax=Euplotes crassus TaxID=5936 RepID=A0AAD1Y261_EUPCR|nr:unnamed protein product [Moneuplotes crassus]
MSILDGKPKSNPNLDWFAFETRIRKVLHDLLEPTAERSIKTKENVEEVKAENKILTRKIEEIEFILHKSHKRSTLFDSVNKRLIDNDSERKILESRLNNEVRSITTEAKGIKQRVNLIGEEVSTINTRIIEHFNRTEELEKRYAEDKKDISLQLQIDDINSQLKVIDEWKGHVDYLLSNYQEDIYRQGTSIEKARKEISECETLIRKDCVKNPSFKKLSEDLDKRLTYCQNSAEDISRNLMSTDNYIEKYLPIKIHKFIVSSLRNVFEDKKDIRKLKDYEAKRDWLLNEVLQNDNGKPGDFKKKVFEDNHHKLGRVKVQTRHKNFGSGSLRKDGKLSSLTSNGTNSIRAKSIKRSMNKSRRGESSMISHQSSQLSGPKDLDEPSKLQNINERVASKAGVGKKDDTSPAYPSTNNYPSIEVKEPYMADKHKRISIEKELPASSKALATIHDEFNSDERNLILKEAKSQEFKEDDSNKHGQNKTQARQNLLNSIEYEDYGGEHNKDPGAEDGELISQNSSSEYGEDIESELDEIDKIYDRKRSMTDLVTMHGLDDEFTKFLSELANDIKELKKKTETIGNNQKNFESNFSKSLQKNFEEITFKVEKDLLEQKEYINSLHQDIEQSIKQSKRDRSDTYLAMQTLKQKIAMVQDHSKKTESYLFRTSSSYMNILESIKSHLYLLKQKDMNEYGAKMHQTQPRPYVASEGDVLNRNRRSHAILQTGEMPINQEAENLDHELHKLDMLLNENNSMLEGNLQNEFEKYEQKALLSSGKKRPKVLSSESMKRLRSAKIRKDAMSPTKCLSKIDTVGPKQKESTTPKLPDFGPFKKSKSKYKISRPPQNFNDRRITMNQSMRWLEQFSPERGKSVIIRPTSNNSRRAESEMSKKAPINQ